MSPLVEVVAGFSILATLAFVYYARVVLPRRFDERYRATFAAFSRAIELRFPSHEGLTERVVELSLATAATLGVRRLRMRRLEDAARLRDIGLCAIPYRLANGRDYDTWSDAERETYFRHAEVGGAILDLIPSLNHLADIVRLSHSDFQEAPNAPIEAKILCAAADAAWLERFESVESARQAILADRGRRFAPEVADAIVPVLTSPREVRTLVGAHGRA